MRGKIAITILIVISTICWVIGAVSAKSDGKSEAQINLAVSSDAPLSGQELPIENFKTINAIVYAYNAEKSQTDDSPCITANGFNLCGDIRHSTVANNCLPFNTHVIIVDTVFVVRDRMNSRYGCNVFDIFMKSHEDAIRWGKKKLEVKIYE